LIHDFRKVFSILISPSEKEINHTMTTYEIRHISPFGYGDYVPISEDESSDVDKVAINILNNVKGLAKIIYGCYNMGFFTEYVRNPPITGNLILSNERQQELVQEIIEKTGIKDQNWAVEFHESKESKETKYHTSRHNE
jgi:hypothetical protein